jgi:hypothetical protein
MPKRAEKCAVIALNLDARQGVPKERRMGIGARAAPPTLPENRHGAKNLI